jgi:CCR4-NOT transcription complex subunit 9
MLPKEPADELESDGMQGLGMNEKELVFQLVVELHSSKDREQALMELSKKRENMDDLALILWHSYGVMAVLLQEVVAVYPLLSPPSLTSNASNRVCNALALLQCIANHPETRPLFLNGKEDS